MKRRFGSIRQRGKRWIVQYTGPDGGRHTPGKSFATEKQAEIWLTQEEALVEQHQLGYTTWTPPTARKAKAEQDTTTVGQWLEQFHTLLEHRPEPPKKSTMQNYRRVTRNRITQPLEPGDDVPAITRLADLPLVKLTKGDVYAWWDGVQQAYPDARTSTQQAYKRLRAACAEAVRRELIPTNPVDVRDAGQKPKPEDKHLPEDWEIDALLQAVPARYRVLTSLTLHHGLRIGEALAVQQHSVRIEWSPVPWMPRVTVCVEQNAQKISDDPDRSTYMLVQEPKTDAGHREVPIMAWDVPVFLEHMVRHAPLKSSRVETWQGPRDMLLLTATDTGRMVLDSSYRNVLDRARKRAGVTSNITPHSGRDWLITRLAEQGAHLKEIGRLLGQQDLDTIMHVYLQVRAGRTTTLMEAVNRTITPGAPGKGMEKKK